MSKVELNVSHAVTGLNTFVEEKKTYLFADLLDEGLEKADRDQIMLTPDEEEMYMMFVEDAVLYNLCR